MRASFRHVAWSLAALCGLAASATAQIRPRTGTITILAGVYSFNEFQGDTDPILGLRGGGTLSESIGLELSLEVIPTGQDVTVLGYHADVVVYLAPQYSAVPYVSVGAGGITFTDGGSETRVAGIVGFGLKVPSGKKVALRLEVRDRIYEVFDDLINDIHFTVGVDFSL